MAAPSQAVLDNFNRANGAHGTAWTSPVWSGDSSPTISSNQLAGAGAFSEAYWNAGTFLDSEAYFTIATVPANNEVIEVYARIQGAGTGSPSYYGLSITRLSGTDTWRLQRYNSGSETILASGSQEIAAGTTIAVVALGNGATVTVQGWYRPSGGSWTQLGTSYADTAAGRITTAGYIGVGFQGTTSRVDDFGGGPQGGAVSGTIPLTSPVGTQALAGTAAPAAVAGAIALTSPVGTQALAGDADATIAGAVALTSPAGTQALAGTATAPAVGGAIALTSPVPALALQGTGAEAVSGAVALTSPAGSQAAAGTVGVSPPRTALELDGTLQNGLGRARIPRTNPARTVSYPTNIGAGDWTIECRVTGLYANNTTAVTDARYANILVDGDIYNLANGMVPIAFTRSGANLVLISGVAAGGAWTSPRGSTNVGDGSPHHVAVTGTRSGGTLTLRGWVDGVLQFTQAYTVASVAFPLGHTSDPSAFDDEYWVIGQEKHRVGEGFRGTIDELRFSTVARYTATFTPPSGPHLPDASTAGLYHLDDATGTTARDSSQVSGAPTAGELLVSAGGAPRWVESASVTSPSGAAGSVALASPVPAVTAAGTATVQPVAGVVTLTSPAGTQAAAGTVANPREGALALVSPVGTQAAQGTAAPAAVAGAMGLTSPVGTHALTGSADSTVDGAFVLVSPVGAPALAGTATAPAIGGVVALTSPTPTQSLQGTTAIGSATGQISLASPVGEVAILGDATAPAVLGALALVSPVGALALAGTATAATGRGGVALALAAAGSASLEIVAAGSASISITTTGG